jgi:hypothetical protein
LRHFYDVLYPDQTYGWRKRSFSNKDKAEEFLAERRLVPFSPIIHNGVPMEKSAPELTVYEIPDECELDPDRIFGERVSRQEIIDKRKVAPDKLVDVLEPRTSAARQEKPYWVRKVGLVNEDGVVILVFYKNAPGSARLKVCSYERSPWTAAAKGVVICG